MTHLTLKRAAWVLGISLLLALIGGYYTIKLYKNLRPDIEELLPTTDRSVIDLKKATERVDSIDYIALLVFTKDTQAGRRFVEAVATGLEKQPRSIVGPIEYHVKQEMEFFKRRQGLYIDTPDLVAIRNYIKDTINYQKEMYSPLNIFPVSDKMKEPKLDIKGLEKKYDSKATGFARFPDGYYANADETLHIMLVYLPGKLAGVTKGYQLRGAIEKVITSLKPTSFAPDLTVKFTGGVEDLLEEYEALTEDLETSTIVVLILVTVAMLAFYQCQRAVVALIGSLIIGTLWTFGLAYFVVGYLNANSAFLGSIVLGNGINFGIIYLARYLEERRRGRTHPYATILSSRFTSKATIVAALAAGLSYGSLMLTGFQGFRQFGIIGLMGMVLCWISAYTALPALLTIMDASRRGSKLNRSRPPKGTLTKLTAQVVGRWAKPITVVTVVLTLASVTLLFVERNHEIIETDLSKLGNRRSQENGSAYLSKYLNEVFRRNLSPIIILTHSREHAKKIADGLKAKKEAEGPTSLITSVYSFEDFLPGDQPEKIKLLKDIRRLLPPRNLKKISPENRKWVDQLLATETKTFEQKDLPPLVIRQFSEKDGSVGNMVILEPPTTEATWEGDRVIKFVNEVRVLVDSVEPGAPVVGHLPITADMNQAIKRDGPIATGVAFLAVVLLVIFLFRNFSDVTKVLLALVLGVLWQVAAVYAFGWKINFLNFIALPITFGIGIDYGSNIYQRYRLDGKRDILKAIRNTGGAVGLASLTTIIGYGSLLIASNRAFVSFGHLAILGEFTCLAAAILSLPAYLVLRSK